MTINLMNEAVPINLFQVLLLQHCFNYNMADVGKDIFVVLILFFLFNVLSLRDLLSIYLSIYLSIFKGNFIVDCVDLIIQCEDLKSVRLVDL